MPRRPLMAGNWKMHKTISESVELAVRLKTGLEVLHDRDALVCPPFTALSAVAESLKGSPVRVGAQNLNENNEGAFTGEVSPGMVKDAGASYVILGHSERRQYYKETDALIHQKIRAALGRDLVPIVCVGETLGERESGKTFSVIEAQLAGCLKGLEESQVKGLVIAYEPVWAIGTGKTATGGQAQEVHARIRGWINGAFSGAAAQAVRILYGGSVKPDNIDALMSQPDIDGGLVGGASLKADDFIRLVKFQKTPAAAAK